MTLETSIAQRRALALRHAARSLVHLGLRKIWIVAGRVPPRGPFNAYVASFVVDQSVETYRVATGRIDRREYLLRSRRLALTTAGGAGGAWAGAALGTLIAPGVGTVLGGAVGGVLGGGAGDAVHGALMTPVPLSP